MSKAKPWNPSADDLRALTEHLLYEVQMTFSLAAWLVHTQGTVLNQTARNAEVEAFTIHVRQLIDFLWMEQPQDEKHRNAFAADYFARGEWDTLRPARPAVLDSALRRKVGWGVAHLTYDRAWSTEQDKQWQPVVLGCALAPAVVCFADSVDPAKFDPQSAVGDMTTVANAFLKQFGTSVSVSTATQA
jgi:hypothetical protein